MGRRLAGLRIGVGLLLATALLNMQLRAQAGTQLLLPSAIAYDAAGNVYFSDTNRNQVLEATLGGQLVVIAGNGVQGFAGDGGSATTAELNAPQGVAIGADGTVYVADTGNQRVRSVTAGRISTIAGNGMRGFFGDGGAATAAELSSPIALAVDVSGALLVCDSGNHRVRRIIAGMIATIAGSGLQGFAGDGGAATVAELDTPMGVFAAADGRIFISDSHNQRVRVVSAAGIMSTFAGTGLPGFAGDGGPATSAKLSMPRGLVQMPSGVLLIADENNQRVRMVNTSGVISTLQGTGVQGSTASDGVNALVAMLNSPRAVGVSAFAQSTVVDAANKSLRVETANAALYAPAGLSATARTSNVILTVPTNAVYGQLSTSVVVNGAVGIPNGSVTWLDAGSAVAMSNLIGGSATTSLPELNAGTHSLSVAYAGDGLNPAAVSTPAIITLSKALSSLTEQVSAQGYADFPITMTAIVSPAASGTPTGTVSFLDGTSVVASAGLVNGIATGTYLSPIAGAHTISANYGGDGNFLPSTSSATIVTVSAVPDFSVSVTNPSQTVPGGLVANYTVLVAGQGAFSGAVSLAASGLPVGATVSFSPPQLVPGAGSATSTMSVQTTVAMAQRTHSMKMWWALGFLLPFATLRRRKMLQVFSVVCVIGLAGCGTRSLTTNPSESRSYTFTMTGTGTNLAGTVVSHSVVVTLVVD